LLSDISPGVFGWTREGTTLVVPQQAPEKGTKIVKIREGTTLVVPHTVENSERFSA
jgi:hypothetical protein